MFAGDQTVGRFQLRGCFPREKEIAPGVGQSVNIQVCPHLVDRGQPVGRTARREKVSGFAGSGRDVEKRLAPYLLMSKLQKVRCRLRALEEARRRQNGDIVGGHEVANKVVRDLAHKSEDDPFIVVERRELRQKRAIDELRTRRPSFSGGFNVVRRRACPVTFGLFAQPNARIFDAGADHRLITR